MGVKLTNSGLDKWGCAPHCGPVGRVGDGRLHLLQRRFRKDGRPNRMARLKLLTKS